MYCPNCGRELDKSVNFCTECGTDVADRSVSGPAEKEDVNQSSIQENSRQSAPGTKKGESVPDESTSPDLHKGVESASGVPAHAVAVDIACQHCGKRPIEEMAKGHRINGFILFYTHKTYHLIGCHSCLRRKLWGMSIKNFFLGWWGLRAAVINAGVTLKNILRGAINRGPNENLVESLEDVGVTYDFLADSNDFDPARHSPMELYIRSFVRLGTAIMLADGEALPEERQAIHDAITSIAPDYPEDKLEDLIDRAIQTPADIERVAEGIGELLGEEGGKLVIAFVSKVADAGVTGDEDIELVSKIARALEMEEDDVRAALNEESPLQAPATV